MAGHTDTDKIKGALGLIGPTAFGSSDDYQAYREALEGLQGNASATAGPDATDAARAKADELGIDLATVTGTGADGRITVDDVEKASSP